MAPDSSGRPSLVDVAEDRVENQPPPNVVGDGEPDPVEADARRYLTIPAAQALEAGQLLQVADVDGELVGVAPADFASDSELAAAIAGLPSDGAANTPSLRRLGTGTGQALAGAQKGAASGVAPLDSGQKIPVENLPTIPISSLEEPVVTSSWTGLAAQPDLLITGTITRDVDGAALSADVVWPDGDEGTYTGTASTEFPGAIDSYTITKEASPTITFTQPAVTRDVNGAVTVRPTITVA